MPYCFVKGCHNSNIGKKKGLSFHRFTKTLHPEWLSAIGRDADIFITHQVICSDHFKVDDFEQNGMRRKIKADVIPTVNLPEQLSSILLKPLGTEIQTDPLEVYFQDVETSTPEPLQEANLYSEGRSSSPLILLMSSGRNTKFNDNIILDFRDSTEIVDKKGESDSCSSFTENEHGSMYQVSSAFHSYCRPFSPESCLRQIKKMQQRGNYFMQKYQKTLKTNIRRKKKISILQTVLRNLKKKLEAVN